MLRLAVATQAETYERMLDPLAERDVARNGRRIGENDRGRRAERPEHPDERPGIAQGGTDHHVRSILDLIQFCESPGGLQQLTLGVRPVAVGENRRLRPRTFGRHRGVLAPETLLEALDRVGDRVVVVLCRALF